ncbi:hypothetical protein BU24DRAFT_405590 [Aaosphaeria arxii CBS 175.79]|uniref:Uncharacterized protein n=1 Tax=Aaosphaeria arxii CBS 175.79 TaxID=1450172 RepID=A0A6A5Y040_9PLEO|nr:uncharacterized protein BU24DRAFT_405590 [Aaosphaeria arxii CBS 175.79]KAF2018842.1 hypothetical protein BU24DRAFT_405590 [Aaosphaeria arxii CBS 175.79]
MARAVQAGLLKGLHFEETSHDHEDLLELWPNDDISIEDQESRRQRIEDIAVDYLIRGKRPLIRSAQLRGPFDGDSWKNPWSRKRHFLRESHPQKSNRTYAKGQFSEETKTHNKKQPNEMGPPSSRFQAQSDSMRDSKSQDPESLITRNSHRPLATSPPQQIGYMDEDLNVNQSRKRSLSTQTSPWLKRRKSGLKANWGHRSSPSPSRPGKEAIALTKTSRLSGRQQFHQDKHDISTSSHTPNPVAASAVLVSRTLSVQHSSAKDSLVEQQPEEYEEHQMPLGDTAEDSVDPPSPKDPASIHPEEQTRNTNPEDEFISAERAQPSEEIFSQLVAAANSQPARRTSPSKEEIQGSAERCVMRPSSAKSTSRRAKKDNVVNNGASHSMSKHTDADPQPKRKSSKGAKPKPRPVTFDSSPIVSKRTKKAAEKGRKITQEEKSKANGVDLERTEHHRRDIYDVPDEDDMTPLRHDPKPSRLSNNYSTQAAMMMAQQEFQDQSMLSPPNVTPGFGTDGQEDERRQHSEDRRSPSVTPFHVFHARLDRHDAVDEMHDVPMSTQEMFEAASPFTFSTIKKKSVMSRHSNLRFTVHPADGRDAPQTSHSQQRITSSTTPPIPSAERIPLKERNSRLSFQSIINLSDKGSQESVSRLSPFTMMLPLTDGSGGDSRPIELPQLNFHDSMEGEGLDFTNGLLQNLEAMIRYENRRY